MKSLSRPPAVAAVILLALVLTTVAAGPSYAERQRTVGAVAYGATSFVAGSAYGITGRVSGGEGRRVRLEVKWADGWHRVDTAETVERGAFALGAPYDWFGTHEFRVTAPATGRFRGRRFEAETFAVSPPYAPVGDPAAYETAVKKGRQLRWDPCRTIRYRINPGVSGDQAVALSQAAVAELTRATGFRARYVGLTDVVPLSDEKYPRGTDLVIAWANETDYPELAGTAGLGGGGRLTMKRQRSNNQAVWQMVSPGATINEAAVSSYTFAMDAPAAAPPPVGQTITHELGHAFGLEHVQSLDQIMYTGTGVPTDAAGWHSVYQAGDLAGLQAQGASGGCLKPLGRGRLTPSDRVPWLP